MCCSLDQTKGRLDIHDIDFEGREQYAGTPLYLKGFYDHTPKTLSDRVTRFFQRLELVEKIAEVADECFHLFNSVFQRYTNLMVYQTLNNLHHATHEVEHFLHAFCFLGDVVRLVSGKFAEYQDGEIDYLRTLSRVCHTTAHFFATAQFLHEHKLCYAGEFEKAFKYASLVSAAGYALWTISLIWRWHQRGIHNESKDDEIKEEGNKGNDDSISDIGIYLGGFLFETINFTRALDSFVSYNSLLKKSGAVAGIIHAWFSVQRLMPKDKEEVSITYILPAKEGKISHHHAHHHHHDHDHHHHE